MVRNSTKYGFVSQLFREYEREYVVASFLLPYCF